MVDLSGLTTETRNERTLELDKLGVAEFLAIMNDEDAKVAGAVRQAIPAIAEAVELIAAAFRQGGRLIYLGAGTSGRLGVLDAVECPPTFGTKPEQVVGLIAGGEKAFVRAVEGAEDSATLAEEELKGIGVNSNDAVVGIAASGRTPYVIGGLDYAASVGAATISVACNPGSAVSQHAQVAIEVDNGPEVLTGSTRLKSGTSQKLILNMLSTASMVQVGKVYGNLMVDVMPTNEKLVARTQGIIATATGCDADTAKEMYEASGGHAKTAIVMILAGVDAEEAKTRLAAADGFVRKAIEA
ncbi:MAG: N-acetylmuramic acid 6-phosphate etherase [Candidatus Nanopelagicales bacterium]